jgi:hypothetical protein
MKMLLQIFALILSFAIFTGCQENILSSIEAMNKNLNNEEFVINEAFLLSDLSQYAVDNTLFIFQFEATENDVIAQNVELHEFETSEWASYFAIIPKYVGSIIQIEHMEFDWKSETFIASPDILFTSISTDDYVLLTKDFLHGYFSFKRITVAYRGISASYDFAFSGIGDIDSPYVADGYVSSRTPSHP